jgi:hypothetical protein
MRYNFLTVLASFGSVVGCFFTLTTTNYLLTTYIWNFVAVCLWLRGEKQ